MHSLIHCARRSSAGRSIAGLLIAGLLIAASAAGLAFASCSIAGDSDQRSAVPARGAPLSYTATIRGSTVGFDMVWVADGGFWIGKTEVTWDEYLLYCDFEKKFKIPPGVDAVSKPSEPLEDVSPYDRDWGIGKRPAVGMSHHAAKQYCRWLSLNTGHHYRLPTEAEWLLACGSTVQTELAAAAWYEANSDQMTHPVGQKQPNQRGLYDMLGNLWEYCAGPYAADQPDRAVLRGGAWSDPVSRISPQSRLGFEEDWILADPNVPPGVWWVPDGDHLGFRVVRVTTNSSP